MDLHSAQSLSFDPIRPPPAPRLRSSHLIGTAKVTPEVLQSRLRSSSLWSRAGLVSGCSTGHRSCRSSLSRMQRAMADKIKAAQKAQMNSGGGARDFGMGDEKKEKSKGQQDRDKYLANKAAEEKEAKDAEKARQEAIVKKGQAAAAAKTLGSKEKTVADLSADDNPKLIAKVVGKALAIPKAESLLPKDVLPLALKKMPDITIPDGTLPKDALLLIAAALAEVKAAKAAKEAAKRAAKKAEAQAKQDVIDAAAAAKKAEATAAREAREAALAAARGDEPEPVRFNRRFSHCLPSFLTRFGAEICDRRGLSRPK